MVLNVLFLYILLISPLQFTLGEPENGICISNDSRKVTRSFIENKGSLICEDDHSSQPCKLVEHKEEVLKTFSETFQVEECCKGYKNVNIGSEPLECKPICDPDCINGNCLLPGECTCHTGYTFSSGSTHQCVPLCTSGCNNGFCSAPEICQCKEGYKLDDEQKCVPKCPIGYEESTLDPGECEPVCDPSCAFGICTAPNNCTCDDGYKISPVPNLCEPICTEECLHGYCSAPETCICTNGYGFLNGSTHKCVPLCEEECVNAVCSEPNICTCWTNYIKVENSNNECKAVCSRPCVNGECTGSEQCTCWTGYKLLEDNLYECEPVCEEECINGYCSGPNNCTCLPNYIKMVDITHKCKSLCSSSCENGKCTGPELCTCLEGYKLSDDPYVCEPYCTEECKNGDCWKPDECKCFEGYILEENSTSKCKPLCSKECVNGYCGSVNCNCSDGYFAVVKQVCNCSVNGDLQRNISENCDPASSIECGNFSDPETCFCDEADITEEIQCEPYCPDGCLHGICTNPNTCICSEGYEKNEYGTCQPTCKDVCINGKCISPEVCDCFSGHIHHPLNRSVCLRELHEWVENGDSMELYAKKAAVAEAYKSGNPHEYVLDSKSPFILGKDCDSLIQIARELCWYTDPRKCSGLTITCSRTINTIFVCELIKENEDEKKLLGDRNSTLSELERISLQFDLLLPPLFGQAKNGSCRLCERQTDLKIVHWFRPVIFDLLPCSEQQKVDTEIFISILVYIIVGIVMIAAVASFMYMMWKKFYKSNVYYVGE